MKKRKEKYETREEMMKGAITFEEMHARSMRNPSFRKAWEARQPAFELRCALIDARVAGEVTQAEIAKRAGTTQSAIARFESGRTSPTLAFMQKLSEALGKRLEVRLVNGR